MKRNEMRTTKTKNRIYTYLTERKIQHNTKNKIRQNDVFPYFANNLPIIIRKNNNIEKLKKYFLFRFFLSCLIRK